MIKKFEEYINEGVRDQMTPKSEEDIRNSVSVSSPYQKIKIGVENDIPWAVQQGFDEAKKGKKILSYGSLEELVFDSVHRGLEEVLDILLSNGVEMVHKQDVLISAVGSGNINILKLLVEKYKYDLDLLDFSMNELYKFIDYGDRVDCIKYVVENSQKIKNNLQDRADDLVEEARLLKQYL